MRLLNIIRECNKSQAKILLKVLQSIEKKQYVKNTIISDEVEQSLYSKDSSISRGVTLFFTDKELDRVYIKDYVSYELYGYKCRDVKMYAKMIPEIKEIGKRIYNRYFGGKND